MPRYDAIVIGGGHNGLVHAAYLARAGRRVLVLERRHVLGGAAVTEEVFPGFKFSVCSYVVSLLRPEIIRELDLPRHGLEILPLDGTFTPMPNGDYLWRINDHARTRREIRRHSRVDAEAYDEYGRAMVEMARFVKPILDMTPPDPRRSIRVSWAWRCSDRPRFRGLRTTTAYNQVQLMTMSAVDFLDQWFETDVLKATMSASGIIGTFLGVRSPGTAYVLLHHYMGEIDGAFRSWGLARGGTGAISNAIASAAREAGVEIRTEAPVARILVREERPRHGRRRSTTATNSPPTSWCRASIRVSRSSSWWARRDLPGDFVEDVKRYSFRGSSGKVNLALDCAAELHAACRELGAHLRGAISISPSVDYMERAYDEAKYGRFSRRPYIDMVIPSLTDPSIAPPGKHVMSCFVQYAPYHLARRDLGRSDSEAFGDTVIDTIAEYAPNIRDIILHRQVLTPLDIERDFGPDRRQHLPGRADARAAVLPASRFRDGRNTRTPIDGLYMCGSATHPGGGIMGAPGRNAALAVLKSGKSSWRATT